MWFPKKCQYCKINQTIDRKKSNFKSLYDYSWQQACRYKRLLTLLSFRGFKSYKKGDPTTTSEPGGKT